MIFFIARRRECGGTVERERGKDEGMREERKKIKRGDNYYNYWILWRKNGCSLNGNVRRDEEYIFMGEKGS